MQNQSNRNSNQINLTYESIPGLTGEFPYPIVHPLHVHPEVVLLVRLETALLWAQNVPHRSHRLHVVHLFEVRLEDL